MKDLLEIGHRSTAVSVTGTGMTSPVDAYTDGHHIYFDDHNVAVVAAHLTGQLDLAGRPVRVERSEQGWDEHRGGQVRPLHRRYFSGNTVYRFDDEWVFSVAIPSSEADQRRSN